MDRVGKKQKKFTVANLHNKRLLDAMSMLSRRMVLDLQSHTSKTLRHGTKVKSLVPGMGRQVGTKVTCNDGKGMRKRKTFRTSQAEGNIFSRPSSSSVVEWHHLSVESDQPRAMIWLFRLCAFAFYSFQFLLVCVILIIGPHKGAFVCLFVCLFRVGFSTDRTVFLKRSYAKGKKKKRKKRRKVIRW